MQTKKILSILGIFVFSLVLVLNLVSAETNYALDASVSVSKYTLTGHDSIWYMNDASIFNDGNTNSYQGFGYRDSDYHGAVGSYSVTLTFPQTMNLNKIEYVRNNHPARDLACIDSTSGEPLTKDYCSYERIAIKYSGSSDWTPLKNMHGGNDSIQTIAYKGVFNNVDAIKLEVYSINDHSNSLWKYSRIYEILAFGPATLVDNDHDGVFNDSDCNDNNPNVWRFLQGYVDSDGDSFGSSTLLNVCSGNNLPSGFVSIDSDCNDHNSLIHPNAAEVCDGINNDCNAFTLDGSGEQAPANPIQYGVCLNSRKSCTSGAWTDNYFSIPHYQAVETSCDLYDNDCDGIVDEGCGIDDTTSPLVNLIRPINGSVFQGLSFPVEFLFRVSDDSSIKSCSVHVSGDHSGGLALNTTAISKTMNNSIIVNLVPGSYSAFVSCTDDSNNTGNSAAINFKVAKDASDTTAPHSISNLHLVSKSKNSLKWAWTNPSDADFAYSIVYIDGVNAANTSNNFYAATDLDSNTDYTITIYTADFSGNINNTDVSNTARTNRDAIIIIGDNDEKKLVVFQDEPVVENVAKINRGVSQVNDTLSITSGKTKSTSYLNWSWLLVLVLFLLIILLILLILYALQSRD